MFKEKEENLILKLPFGFRDILPVEAHERREIEDMLRAEFTGWGYGEVRTPVIEYTKNISAGAGADWKDKLISFFDNDGNIVSLRTDMTVPIARLAGMRLKKDMLPARFFYFANSFRQSDIQKGAKRVVNQAGLELIGPEGMPSDIEALNILMNILSKLGINDFRIAAGNMQFIEGTAGWLGLDSREAASLKSMLLKRDMVAMGQLLSGKDEAKKELFFELIKPSADMEKLKGLCEFSGDKKMISGFNYIAEIYNICESAGFKGQLIIDLGIVRNFGYYSGLIFEAYAPGITELLGSGGSYDGLVKKFGLNVPGTGFALDVDILHRALKSSDIFSSNLKKKALIIAEPAECRNALLLAGKLRKTGTIVELLFGSYKSILEICMLRKASSAYVADFKNNEAVVFEFSNDYKESSTRKVKLFEK